MFKWNFNFVLVNPASRQAGWNYLMKKEVRKKTYK